MILTGVSVRRVFKLTPHPTTTQFHPVELFAVGGVQLRGCRCVAALLLVHLIRDETKPKVNKRMCEFTCNPNS